MGKNTSISIGPHFEEFMEQIIESGRFHSKSEVVRAGLRLLEDEESKIANLRAAIKEGQESGYIDNFDFDKHKASLKRKVKK